MIDNKIVQLSEDILLSPFKLFFYILYNIYYMFFTSAVGFSMAAVVILNAILYNIFKNSPLIKSLYTLIGFLLIIPITIALEEFFHAATAIARGKKHTVNSFVIGYYKGKNKNISPAYFAISYYGNFNIIDRFYISAGGPVGTIYTLMVIGIFLNFIYINSIINIVMILSLIIPLIGLIPSKFIIQSDGFSIVESAKKLNIPLGFALINLAASIKYAIRYLVKPRREFGNDYLKPGEALRLVEEFLERGNNADAVNTYIKLLKIDPYNSLYLNNIAWLLYEMGRYREALTYSKRCIKLSPKTEEYMDTYKSIMTGSSSNEQIKILR